MKNASRLAMLEKLQPPPPKRKIHSQPHGSVWPFPSLSHVLGSMRRGRAKKRKEVKVARNSPDRTPKDPPAHKPSLWWKWGGGSWWTNRVIWRIISSILNTFIMRNSFEKELKVTGVPMNWGLRFVTLCTQEQQWFLPVSVFPLKSIGNDYNKILCIHLTEWIKKKKSTLGSIDINVTGILVYHWVESVKCDNYF